jgi:hypothetical protein
LIETDIGTTLGATPASISKSAIQSITVNQDPAILTQPSSVTADHGQPDAISSTVEYGTGPYTWQWYDGSDAITGATGYGTTAIYSAPSSDTGIYVTFMDSLGVPATSNPVSVTVNPQITVTGYSATSPVDAGQLTSLTASAPSGGNGYYTTEQWYFNTANDNTTGTAIATTGLTITNTPLQSGYYYLVVSDGNSTTQAITPAISVTVNPQITITSATVTSPVDPGQPVSLSALAEGGTGTYTTEQWYYSQAGTNSTGTPAGGGPGIISTDTPSTSGFYYLVVSDGNMTTEAVTPPLAVTVNPT